MDPLSMKKLQQYLQMILALSVMFISACSSDEVNQNVRLKENINRDWQFTFSSETDIFTDTSSKAAEWQTVGLPELFGF